MLQGLTSGLRAFCTKSSVVHRTAGLHIRNKTQNQSIQSLLRSPLETDTPVTVQVHTTSISYDKWAKIQESMGILMSIMTRLHRHSTCTARMSMEMSKCKCNFKRRTLIF